MAEETHGAMRPLLYFTAVMLVLAVPPVWPYVYYQLLRVVVCGTSAYTAYTLTKTSNPARFALLIGIAILFNPVVPVHMSKGVWVVLDLLTALVFVGIARAEGGPDG